MDQILADLSSITGWPVRRQVQAEMIPPASFRRLLEKRLKTHAAPKEIRIQELALKMFGLIPRDFNLAGETVDLLSEQAAAYYDYNKQRLFVIESTPPGYEQEMALVHELAHALADQQHHLGKYLRKGDPEDDASSARDAVIEGQANWLTWAYLSKHRGGAAEVSAQVLREVTTADTARSVEFPVFSKAPLYIRDSLTFPYNDGMRFQDSLFRTDGRRAFDEGFERPPSSTQQIMHVEAYTQRREPTHPKLPPSHGYRPLMEGVLGEFDFSALLRQHIGETRGSEAASHWRGAFFRLSEEKKTKQPVLSYVSDWDSPEAAARYFDLYQEVLAAKWKNFRVESKSPERVSGTGDSGKFELRLSGTLVQAIEGLR